MRKIYPLIVIAFSMTLSSQTFFKDLKPGVQGSTPRKFVECNNMMFFFAEDSQDSYWELWTSDGTAAGTHIVKEIRTNGGSIDINTSLVALNNYVYFIADDGVGKQVWRSDGTSGGTIKLSSSGGFNAAENITACNGWIYFTSFDLTYGRELWRTDGTANGTTMVADIHGGTASGIPSNTTGSPAMADVNGTLYFVGTDGTSGYDIFKSDGTAIGTTLVKDMDGGNNTSNRPENLFAFNGNLYFVYNDNTAGREVFTTNGTQAGTVLLKDIFTGQGQFDPNGSQPESFIVSNNKLFFTAYNDVVGRELYVSDGTPAGTNLLKDLNPGINDMAGFIYEFGDAGNRLYFNADVTANGEVWYTDGTAAGTKMVKSGLAVFSGPTYHFYYHGGRLYFGAMDANLSQPASKLYITNGTLAGTYKLTDTDGALVFSNPSDLFAFGGKIFFAADDDDNGRELWVLDPAEIKVGIDDMQQARIGVYPNPFSSELTLNTGNEATRYLLFNNLGQVVKRGAGTVMQGGELRPGMYIIETNGVRMKVVKE